MRSVLVVLASILAASSVACAESTDEDTTVAGEAVSGTTYTKKELSLRVTEVYRYVMGGADPSFKCTYGGSPLWDNPGLAVLRSDLAATAPGSPAGHDTCSTVGAQEWPVDGIDVSAVHVHCPYVSTDVDLKAIAAIPRTLDHCWYNGTDTAAPVASDFWDVKVFVADQSNLKSAGYRSLDIRIDPEPAHLNGALTSKGSAASATFTISNAPTTAFQWPSSWAVGNMPAGAPCATYAAGSGVILYSTIQASGSYRKCM